MTDATKNQQKAMGLVGTQPISINTLKAKEQVDENEEAVGSISPIREKMDMRSWKPRRPSETIHADAGSRLFHLRRLSDA